MIFLQFRLPALVTTGVPMGYEPFNFISSLHSYNTEGPPFRIKELPGD